ncbi:DNA distortion polypeptide 1 [Xenorhabdus entomophaga]|uniref:DNA distortion polypeptide 1 n=1 Tax=Xenorhabdus entomophaga TaxID=3136257 RepID=UPI0030F418CD
MKQIIFRLSNDDYVRANVNALAKGFDNVNTFAKYSVLDCDVVLSEIEVKNEASKQVSVSLYPHEIVLLERNAKLHGMSLSREIAIRLRQSCLKNETCLYPQELNELKKLSTSIDRIGRNIHFIIKGERFCTVNDPEFRREIVEVVNLCKNIDSKIELLISSVANRFG